ncbi:MAG: adenylyl-sulfate kinase, partial [bacterium]
VVVNKMDLVGFKEATFKKIKKDFTKYLKGLNVIPNDFVPASAREGDNVVTGPGSMSWYKGPTVLESLENFRNSPPDTDKPLRFPVQDIYKFDGRRIVAGRVAAGTLKVGDRLVFSPSNKTAVVNTIEAFNVPYLPAAVSAGRSTGITLDEQIFIERGEIASLREAPPEVSNLFRANVFWMGDDSLVKGRTYELRLTTKEMDMEVVDIHNIIDASTLDKDPDPVEIGKNEVAEVTIGTKHPIVFDRYSDIDVTGRFVIVDNYDVSGGGIIVEPLADEMEVFRREARLREFEWRKGEVKLSERTLRIGHNPGMILFTGESGTGKARLGRKLERRLFDGGKQVYLLDAKNLMIGREGELSSEDKSEMIRRFADVAQIMLRAGTIVVSTTNTFALADHQPIRELVHPHRIVTVHMAFQEDVLPENTDLDFLEPDDFDEAAKTILKKMEEKGILF